MKTREKIIASFMAVVFIFWVSNFFKKPEDKKTAGSRVPSSPKIQPQEPADKEAVKEKEAAPADLAGVIAYIDMKYADPRRQDFKDPFEKLDPRSVLDTTAVDFTELELSGIIWEEQDPMALINDQILKRGDMISGFKIYEIRRSEVVLIKGLERYILKLPNQVKEEDIRE